MKLLWKKKFPVFCLVIILAVGGLAGGADVSPQEVLAQEASSEEERVETCNATAPDFSICVNSTVDDHLFIENGVGCPAGCSMTLDYNFDGISAGNYTYNVTCDNGVCPPGMDTGTVTVYLCETESPDADSSAANQSAGGPLTALPPYTRITSDEDIDWDPVVDNGLVAWARGDEGSGSAEIWFYDGSATELLATVSANPEEVYLDIDNGWVFWEAPDEYWEDWEKWVYNSQTDELFPITGGSADDDWSRYRFENGKVLWQRESASNSSLQDLMFFDGFTTMTLAVAGNYSQFAFRDGWVVWEQPTGGSYEYSYKIMLSDGSAPICISDIGVASSFGGHTLRRGAWFLRGGEGECIQGQRVAWMGWDPSSGYEILFYDGMSVQQLTDNLSNDENPQVWGNQVAWGNTLSPWSLMLYNGEEDLLLTNNYFTEADQFTFEDGRVVWWMDGSGQLRCYDTESETLTVLEDFPYSPSGPSIHGVVVDDKGICWYYQEYTTDWEFTLKLFDGSAVYEVGTMEESLHPWKYQGGFVAWNDERENTYACLEWDGDSWEEVESTVQDTEVFLYSLDAGVEQVTEEGTRNCASLGGLDNGQVVWSGQAETLPKCGNCASVAASESKRDIFLAGWQVGELSIAAEDISLGPILRDGTNVTVTATVHNDGPTALSEFWVDFLVDSELKGSDIISVINPGSTADISFPWKIDWTIKDRYKQGIQIEIVVDSFNEIIEINEADNNAIKNIPKLQKGQKWGDVDGRGFHVSDAIVVPYAVPIAIWFDDDAKETDDGRPTRHYNPIATKVDVINDIETDFSGDQTENGIDALDISDFATLDAKDTVKKYWQLSSGIVIVDSVGKIVAAPIASYLNWPIVSDWVLDPAARQALEDLINDLGVTYVLVIVEDNASAGNIVTDLAALDLLPGKLLMVKTVTVEPLDDDGPVKALMDAMSAFGERPSGIVVTNSRDDSCLAAAPLAAFYKSAILDVRDVVTAAVDYGPDSYAGLQAINNKVSDITDKAGSEHDIKGFVQKYPEYRAGFPIPLYLVGIVEWLPFGIKQEPAGLSPTDDDKDWIATDYDYYHAHPAIYPGGRFPLIGNDNVNYVAVALQFDELPAGGRDGDYVWEDNILGAGIYSPDGKRNWEQKMPWWLDSVVYQLEDLSEKNSEIEITRLFETPSLHGGGWGENWYRFDNLWGQWKEKYRIIKKAPLFWDTRDPQANPEPPGNRGDGVNNDGDKIGYENNDGKFPIERIIDVDDDGKWTEGLDVALNEGLTPGIQAADFVENADYCIDEEVWDGFDNDGDGTIDEDCSFYHLMEVNEVYNEALSTADPDIDWVDFLDLIDSNLISVMHDEGLIIYSGHAWTDVWAMSNTGGNQDPDGAGPIPPKTSDDRTYDQTHLHYNEVPQMAPALVIASACGSARSWENNCIGQAFLKQGALAYIGATAIAYGSSDELRQQMFNRIINGKLHVGRAFKFATDNLDTTDLWAARAGEDNRYVTKTKYEFGLFGLGSTEIDPGGDGEQHVTYGDPVYNSLDQTWSLNITFDIPVPDEITDGQGNVTGIIMPHDLLTWFSDTGDYPALRLVPFDYELPVGGSLVDVSLAEALAYDSYNFSLPKVTDYPKWPPDDEEHQDVAEVPDEELGLYDGVLFPDVLFVSDSEYDSLSNSDRVFGSVTAYQIDGTVNTTTVYDSVVLSLTYTAPLGLEEIHVVDGGNLTVNATMVSTDGGTHFVTPTLRIETVGGLVYRTVTADNVTVGATPQTVAFDVQDIELSKYVGRIIVTEGGNPVAETSFSALEAYSISLAADWNLVSLPLIPDNTDIADVTAGINDTLAIIWGWDAEGQAWLWYVPDNFLSSLTTMEPGSGYWFFMYGPAILEVSGQEMPDPPTLTPAYDVFEEWNLIGFTSTTGMSPESYLASIAGNYSIIWGWDAEEQAWLWYVPDNFLSSLTTMEPGFGFWLWGTAEGTIVPPT